MIVIKSKQEIEKMAAACRIVAEVIERLGDYVRSGVSTADIDGFADGCIRQRGGVPAFKGYRDYPASACISVNDQVIHGIPSRTVKLKRGDIVSVDLGVLLDGFYGDGAVTLAVGQIDPEARRLMDVTRKALALGIAQAVVGNRISDVSAAIQRHVEANGFSVVRAFVGHGIGRSLHEEPQVPNFGKPGQGARLREGMTLAIEPMVNAGSADVRILEDGWTAVTADGSLSAHFEHTIAVTQSGPKVLTSLTKG